MVERNRLIATSAGPEVQLSPDDIGPPGAQVVLRIVAKFEGDHRSDADRLDDKSERPFKVAARMSASPIPSTDGNVQGGFTAADGGSFLLMPPDPKIASLRVDVPQGAISVAKNPAGELSLLEFECVARSPEDARAKFVEAAASALDHWSYSHNVPIYLATPIRVEDTKNTAFHYEFVGPYRKAHVASAPLLFEEMRPIYSMYREAKNADSDYYRFLCYYKILEGLFGQLRRNLFKRAGERGITVTDRDAGRVPDDSHIGDEFRQYVGWPMKKFVDEVLYPQFRNAVAHLVTDDGQALQASSPINLHRYAHVAYISDLCVRILIDKHERALTEVGS